MLKIMALVLYGLLFYYLGSRQVKPQVIIKEVQLEECKDIIDIAKEALDKANWALSAYANNAPYWNAYPDSLTDTRRKE